MKAKFPAYEGGNGNEFLKLGTDIAPDPLEGTTTTVLHGFCVDNPSPNPLKYYKYSMHNIVYNRRAGSFNF